MPLDSAIACDCEDPRMDSRRHQIGVAAKIRGGANWARYVHRLSRLVGEYSVDHPSTNRSVKHARARAKEQLAVAYRQVVGSGGMHDMLGIVIA